jgi:hypothetical protein
MTPLIPANAGTQMEWPCGRIPRALSLSNHLSSLGIWVPAFAGMSGF